MMYDIRQFMPALYILVLLGLSGFAISSGSPGLWVLGASLVLINMVLIASGRFRPLPRLLANALVVAAMLYVAMQITGDGSPVLVVGQFLVALQLVKLYEQRANRDYGQILVLSLLLMVAAAISTYSLAFGVLMILYLFLSLYCCLLFHLKVETDAARKAMGLAEQRPADQRRLRQDQRRLSSSMRRLTALVSTVAIGCAVLVFVAFPRSSSGNLMMGPRFKASQAVTGFSGHVSFQQIARITQNHSPVAYFQMLRNGQPVRGNETIYLRGSTLDIYVADPDAPDRWTWKRSPHETETVPLDRGSFRPTELGGPMRRPSVVLEQRFELEPVGLDVLPMIAGAFLVQYNGPLARHSLVDNTLRTDRSTLRSATKYNVWSTGQIPEPLRQPLGQGRLDGERLTQDLRRLAAIRDRAEAMRLTTAGQLQAEGRSREEWFSEYRQRFGQMLGSAGFGADSEGEAPVSVHALPYPAPAGIIEFAIDPEVSGTDQEGVPLAQRRLELSGSTELDESIARNIERYLQRNYAYTLDITDARLSSSQDPMVWFVSEDGRRGHCEYFAGTNALALQAMGIPARVVVGFRTDEYNTAMDRWVVRQSHAHAWVEVLTQRGWVTLDPTASGGSDVARAESGFMQSIRHWMEFLEWSWANNVVAYDGAARQNLIQTLEADVMQRAQEGAGLWASFQEWLERQNLYIYSAKVMAWLIVLMTTAAVGSVAWFLVERWRLRRRARRIGLAGLPPNQARRLARQLVFYDDLMRLLARHGHVRRPSQTPREFAQSLTVLPRQAYDGVLSLTEIFYKVRYGQWPLTRRRRRWVHHAVDRLGTTLDRPQTVR